MRTDDTAPLNLPLYSFAEADHLANVPSRTSKRWLTGYHYLREGERVTKPPVTIRDDVGEAASFLDLVEIVAIGGLKTLGFTLIDIRKIVDACQDLFQVERPLTTLELKIGGREVFVHAGEDQLIEVLKGRGRRVWSEVLEPFLQTLDHENQVARRWWPMGKAVPVLIDPSLAFGLPVIADTGVRTEIIFERFQVGELTSEIADDFNLTPDKVERAVQFEVSRLKAA